MLEDAPEETELEAEDEADVEEDTGAAIAKAALSPRT